MKEFRIAILLATYNRDHLIVETLHSIKKQSWTAWQCVIVDDCSTDNTAEIVLNEIKDDPRFEFHIKPHDIRKGLSASRNYGLEVIKEREFDFVQFFDDDDLMHPEKLKLQVEYLLKNPDAKFVICGNQNFRIKSEINWKEVQRNFCSRRLNIGEAYLIGDLQFVAQVPLFRREFLKDVKFDEELFYAEEWALFSMLFLLRNPEFGVIEKVLFYRRKHPDTITAIAEASLLKRKTSIMVNRKIFDFLKLKDKHNRLTLFYFARIFLFYDFDINYLADTKLLIKTSPSCRKLDYVRFNAVFTFNKYLRKIFLKTLYY